ncbi:MAG: substrate-binding domain-containing protein [Tepidisphaerales bacterium]
MSSLSGGREVARGACRYIEQLGHTETVLGDELTDPRELARVASMVDGILLVSPTHAQARTAVHLHVPVVAVSCDLPGLVCVNTDDHQIGRVAHQHLRSLGLTQFASVGIGRAPFSVRRQDGFDAAATRFRVQRYRRPLYTTIFADPDELEQAMAFVRSLPTPCGVFAATTALAATFIRIARHMGKRVPQDFAVIGVTNDDMACEYTRPGITVVDDRSAVAGAEAVKLLLSLIDGAPRPAKPIVVPCGDAIVRSSSDVLAVDDPDVRAAVELIRSRALGPVRVADIVRDLPVSRRKLERAFVSKLGRTMHDEIIRVRIDHARRLLRNTSLPMKEIASLCGFSDDSKFSTAFKKTLGITPRDYRRQSLLGG